ncbi:MAG: 6-carboxytetrahydropterin synthase QueD [Vulcanimicrobiaceae bacterium]
MEIRKRFHFEAAHHLPHHRGKCARPHGHSYILEVAIRGAISQSGPDCGMVLDFDALSEVVDARVVDRLDHTDLNAIIENPTAENIAQWIWHELAAHVNDLHEVVLWETATACALLRADMLA